MTPLLLIGAAVVGILIFLAIQYNLFSPRVAGLPIVMYHRVSQDHADRSTVSVARLREQFEWYRDQGYETISFTELKAHVDGNATLPPKPLLLTFDDATQDNHDHALPLLKEFGFKATFFVPMGSIGELWESGPTRVMDVAMLRNCVAAGIIELAYHSYAHRSYAGMTNAEIDGDIAQCVAAAEEIALPFASALAYPYGKMPGGDLRPLLNQHDIYFGVRIGSRINSFPLSNCAALTRIDIRGADSMATFRVKLQKGRARLFA